VNALANRLLAGILLLLAVLALSNWFILTQAARSFSDELTQQLNGSIAMYVVREAPLIHSGVVNTTLLARLARQAMVVNPMAEVYLLDPRGGIIGRRADAATTVTSIDLGPIRAFLAGTAAGPLYATDPRHVDRPRVFSAAEVRDHGQLEGYVYVVLGGAQAASLREALSGSYILRAALGMLLVLLVLAALAAWALTLWLTRPIRQLHDRVLQLGKDLGAGTLGAQVQGASTLGDVRNVFEILAKKLHAQVIELRQADRLRRELFTNVSHDLRTPLTAMRGYIDTIALNSDQLSRERQREFIAIASRHCDRLNRLVDQIFSLARLDVAAIRLRPEPVSLAELAQDIVKKYQLLAESMRLRLQLEIDPRAPQVAADIGLLETVFENLLDNAMRHSAAGSEIVVSVATTGDNVRAQVSDRGSGIETADLQRITQRFESGSGGRTGLGLAIVTRILELHGSALELTSTPGRGTTAAFGLPVLRALPNTMTQQMSRQVKGRDDFVTG
jgi:signal transduction histidine kinase